MTLGEKIRTLRKARGMTQRELAGEEFTRNMLSRIESDAALPSLPSLRYLARKLEVPAGYLLDEDGELYAYRRLSFMPAIRRAFAEGRLKEVLALAAAHGTEGDDELALLLAETAVRLSLDCIHSGKMTSAAQYAASAEEHISKTAYPTNHLRATLSLVKGVIANVQAPKYEVADGDYLRLANRATETDLYHYLAERTEGYTFHDPKLAAHVEGKRLMAAGRYADAIRHFEALEETRSEQDTSVFLIFRLYGDLEICHKELRNFEAAYRYSAKRLSLLSAFRS